MLPYSNLAHRPEIMVILSDGNCPYFKAGDRFPAELLVPNEVCPYLFHSLIPYWMTLINGGWFRWVKKDTDIELRIYQDELKFNYKRINSFFTNEVLVQCPNPYASIVVGVGVKKERSSLTLRVLDGRGECPYHYHENQEFVIPKEVMPFCPSAYNTIFPYLLMLSLDGKATSTNHNPYPLIQCPSGNNRVLFALGTNMDRIDISNTKDTCFHETLFTRDLSVSTDKIKSPCRYHKVSTTYSLEKLSPNGLCLEAYHAIYPFALARLYDAWDDRTTIKIHCPRPGGVIFEVNRSGKYGALVRRVRRGLAQLFNKFFYPVDLLDCRVEFSVVAVDDNGCPAQHERGDRFEFNIDDETEICPASFHSIYPYLFLQTRSFAPIWGNEGEWCIPCPDCQGAIYKIK